MQRAEPLARSLLVHHRLPITPRSPQHQKVTGKSEFLITCAHKLIAFVASGLLAFLGGCLNALLGVAIAVF